MATKVNHNVLGDDTTPDWTTQKKQLFPDGTLVGIDNQVWLYKRVPLGPVDTATTTDDALAIGTSINNAMIELESITRTPVARRQFAKSRYREIHMLLVNIPQRYVPGEEQPLRDFLSQMWPNRRTMRRVLLFGVRLNPSLRGKTWNDTVDNVSRLLTLSDNGVNMNEYAEERKRMDALLTRSGFVTPTPDEMRLADSWWNEGRNPDIPYLVHADHLHMFTQPSSMNEAARLERDEIDCRDEEWRELTHHHTLSMSAFDSFKFEFRPAGSPIANYVSEMLRKGAMAVSWRGFVEPTNITSNQLRAGNRSYVEDLRESDMQMQIAHAETEEKQAAMAAMMQAYARSNGRVPTLHKASIIVAVNGYNASTGQYSISDMNSVEMSSMVERQESALAEMMMGSKYRKNPLLRDLPAPAIAFTGAPSLATVGDKVGALLGMTEFDDQPAYLSPTAASTADGLPLMLVAGATGSGKAMDLDTLIATPTGSIALRDAEVGTEVLSRDGSTTTLTALSDIRDDADAFRLSTSGGQHQVVDGEHQFVVVRHDDTDPDLARSIAALDALRLALAEDASERSVDELFALIDERIETNPFSGPESVRAALAMVEANRHVVSRPSRVQRKVDQVTKVDPVKVWPVVETLDAAIAVWQSTSGGNATRWAEQLSSRIEAATALRGEVESDAEETAAWIARELIAHGAVGTISMKSKIAAYARAAGIEPRDDRRAITVPVAGDYLTHRPVHVYATNEALTGLVARLHQRATGSNAHSDETRMTLNEMLAIGLVDRAGRARFSIRTAVAHPGTGTIDEPFDPAIFGADIASRTLAFETGVERWGDLDDARRQHVLTLGRSLGFVVYANGTELVVDREAEFVDIIGVEPVPSRPMRCISVAHPDRTYLTSDFLANSNTQVLLFLAVQFDEMGCPQVIIDFKRKSDHARVVEARGGQVYRLDSILEADGVFDPLRFSQDIKTAINRAAQMLLYIDPWGEANIRKWESKIGVALTHGVEKGATCIGQALKIALADGVAPPEMVNPILEARNSYSLMSAIVGLDPKAKGLAIADGMTLIMTGEADMPLPRPGSEAEDIQQRLGVSIVRAAVFGSAMALTERRGVLHFDEAWIAMVGGASEVEQLGRLARSQEVFPILYTQRVSDVLDAGLRGYISRGLILAIKDKDEARAACELFEMEPTPERLARITADATIGGSSDTLAGQPNYNSLRALFSVDPVTGKRIKNVRGSVGLYRDLDGRVCPVVIDIPGWLLKLTSTNVDDIRKRKEDAASIVEESSKLSKLGSEETSHAMMAANAEREAAAAAAAQAAMDYGDDEPDEYADVPLDVPPPDDVDSMFD